MTLSLCRLEKSMLLLLFLPLQIFVLGWLNIMTLVVVLPFLWAATYLSFRSFADSSGQAEFHIRKRSIFGLTLIALIWTGFSGTAGIGFQNWDHEKHNAMLFDLVKHTYPVFYPPQKELNLPTSSPLVFYIGYYLLPAWVGKITNFKIANLFQFAQLFLTVELVFLWIVTRFRATKPYYFIFFFILFSGNDWLGSYINSHQLPKLGDHLEWWTIFQYSSITTQLFWVPHQSTIAWLGTILSIGALRDQSLGRYFLVLTLGLLWSPFVVIGLLPFGLLFLNQLKIQFIRENHFKDVLICFLCLPLTLLLILYFESKSSSIAIESTPSDLWTYLQFTIFEWAWFVPFLVSFRRNLTLENKKLLFITSLSLVVIPFCQAPGVRDFIMRASMPSLFCLIFILMSVLRNLRFPQSISARIVLGFTCLILPFTWITPAFEICRSIARYSFQIPRLELKDQVPSLWPPTTAQQYLGQSHSLFFTYFSRIPQSDSE